MTWWWPTARPELAVLEPPDEHVVLLDDQLTDVEPERPVVLQHVLHVGGVLAR